RDARESDSSRKNMGPPRSGSSEASGSRRHHTLLRQVEVAQTRACPHCSIANDPQPRSVGPGPTATQPRPRSPATVHPTTQPPIVPGSRPRASPTVQATTPTPVTTPTATLCPAAPPTKSPTKFHEWFTVPPQARDCEPLLRFG